VFVLNPDNTTYIGQVWPGFTVCDIFRTCVDADRSTKVFPDWFANETQNWWGEALMNWSASGIEFSGLWLDMNEASSFCVGSWYNTFRFITVPH